MSAETAFSKRKPPSRKSGKSATALEPLITRLYDGTAELLIRMPQKQQGAAETLHEEDRLQSADESLERKERIELNLPSAGRNADENDRVIAFSSFVLSVLLKDIAASKQQNRKALQAAGIRRAKAAGKQFGRRALDFDTDLFEEICWAYAYKDITADTAGERLGCSARTFRRRYVQWESQDTDAVCMPVKKEHPVSQSIHAESADGPAGDD